MNMKEKKNTLLESHENNTIHTIERMELEEVEAWQKMDMEKPIGVT